MPMNKTCGHGVPFSEKFCRGCRLVWCREMLRNAERDVRRFAAEIAELERIEPDRAGPET